MYNEHAYKDRMRLDIRVGNHLDKLGALNPRILKTMDELQAEINHLITIRDQAYGKYPDPNFNWPESRAFTRDEIKPVQDQYYQSWGQYNCLHRHIDDYGEYLSCRDCGARDYGSGWEAVIHEPIVANIEAAV